MILILEDIYQIFLELISLALLYLAQFIRWGIKIINAILKRGKLYRFYLRTSIAQILLARCRYWELLVPDLSLIDMNFGHFKIFYVAALYELLVLVSNEMLNCIGKGGRDTIIIF